MPETPSLGLPLLVAEQAQKHVTHNEALTALDAIVELAVLDRDIATPPGSPGEGDRYIVAAGATDEWAGHDGEIAAWQGGAWNFYAPREGWRCWADDEDVLLIFDGAAWIDLASAITELQNLALLGIGTPADATNPLSAKLNKALWTAKYAAEGGDGDLRYTMNKETAADVLSLLLQTGFSGRAEIGLIGDDDLLFKVSPDGSTWHEALRIDKDNGETSVGYPMTSLAVAGPILHHDPAADPNDGGYKFRLSYVPIAFSNGPVGEVNYTDDIWGFGVNASQGGGGRIDTSKPSLALTFESKYYNAGKFGSEAHIQMIDTAGAVHRPYSSFHAHDGTSADVSYQATNFRFYNWSDLSNPINIDLSGKTIDLSLSTKIRSSTNNVGFLQQINAAANSYKNLLFLNSSDQGRMEVPILIFADATSLAALRVQASAIGQGGSSITAPGPTFTGDYNAFDVSGAPDGSVSGTGLTGLLRNTDTTHGSAHARLKAQSGGASGGDPIVEWRINSVISAVAGLDNSDSDKWKLAYNSQALGTNDVLAIDASKVAFFIAPKLPSYTVAGVPSAATLGARAAIYVSDESGGATLAFSDGTNWKRVSDLATIS